MTHFLEPLPTYEMRADNFSLESGSTYLHSTGTEERSALDADWTAQQDRVSFLEVVEVSDEEISIEGAAARLKDAQGLGRLIGPLGDLYLDITGMTYSTWAPVLAVAIRSGSRCRVIYREPSDYRRSATPTRGMIYDLSEGVAGIGPLPGLASIRRREDDLAVLVPLLGFEGARLAHVLNTVDPPDERVVPVIGVPGFRPEFTAQAFIGNRLSLEQDYLFSKVQFAKANCPFDLFHLLQRIQADFGGAPLRIAPVGTKPHGLGAVLFALSRPDRVEIVYDHPRRRTQRTSGMSRVCLYEVSDFVQSDLFKALGEFA